MSGKRWKAAAAGAVVVASASIATPVSATGFDNDGSWSDEHTISKNGLNSGNLIGMWQSILIADEVSMPGSYSNGSFGTNTDIYTKYYQAGWGISVDGVVGPQTWNVARLSVGTPSNPGCTTNCFYDFNASGAPIEFWQNKSSGGSWKWTGFCPVQSGTNGWQNTNHPAVGFAAGCQ